jgi:hypothetical protein
MTVITPEILDKVDRFRAQTAIDIKSLELPDELSIALRQGINRFINKAVDDAIVMPATNHASQPVNPGVEF